MTKAVDPGWGDALGQVPRMFVPTKATRLVAESVDGLGVMRVLWLIFVAAMLLIGTTVAVIDRLAPGGGADGRVVGAVVAAVAVSLQLLAPKFVPAIDGATNAAVRAQAQRAFFVRVAFAEPAALLGFMGFVVSGNVAVYVLGALIGLAGMYDAAPNRRWFEAGNRSLRAAGSDVDFLTAITQGGITR